MASRRRDSPPTQMGEEARSQIILLACTHVQKAPEAARPQKRHVDVTIAQKADEAARSKKRREDGTSEQEAEEAALSKKRRQGASNDPKQKEPPSLRGNGPVDDPDESPRALFYSTCFFYKTPQPGESSFPRYRGIGRLRLHARRTGRGGNMAR